MPALGEKSEGMEQSGPSPPLKALLRAGTGLSPGIAFTALRIHACIPLETIR